MFIHADFGRQHYYLLGRSTRWWPRSQRYFNVVISSASLGAKRWIPKSRVHWGCVCVFGGDKLNQINEGKTHSLMEDGKESPLIKNMKMNKISGSFGSIWTATVILPDLHLIKKGCESVLHHFLCVLWGTKIFILFFMDADNVNRCCFQMNN